MIDADSDEINTRVCAYEKVMTEGKGDERADHEISPRLALTCFTGRGWVEGK